MAVAALAIFFFNLFRYRDYLLDDTFISLRYARNLVEGNGLVFNVGERVEGYTNFLLVMLAAGCMRLGIDAVVATQCLAAGASLAVMYLVTKLERSAVAPGASLARVPLALLFLLPLQAFAYWSVSGMETMLFTALLLAGVYLTLQEVATGRWRGSAVVFVLLALTRPEGVFAYVLCTGVCFVLESVRRPSWQHARRYAAQVGVFAVGFGTYFGWRYAYYGHLFPNTFYAKVTGGEWQLVSGVRYLRDWALAFPLLAATLLLPLLAAFPPMRVRLGSDAVRIATAVLALAWAAYVVAVGGDFMVYFRFFMPMLPLCCVLLAWSLAALLTRLSPRARVAGLAVVWMMHVGCSLLTDEPYRAFVAHRTAVIGAAVGRWLAGRLPADAVIAVNTAGSLPYYSNLPAIDTLGLTDESIARRPVFIVSPGWAGHRRGWGEYVIARRPRVLLWYNSAGAREPYYLGDHELAENPFFRFFYRLKTATLPAVAGGREHAPVERFLGLPFGYTPAGHAEWGELGLSGDFRTTPVTMTTFYEAPIVVNYFERDARDDALWDLKGRTSGDLDQFLGAVTQRWIDARASEAPGDPAKRAQVETMCEEAHRLITAGDYRGAGNLLAAAAQLNDAARSPLVYQYTANLAVMAGDLFTAVAAQKEALRLAPGNELYRGNLRGLLTVPYKQGSKPYK